MDKGAVHKTERRGTHLVPEDLAHGAGVYSGVVAPMPMDHAGLHRSWLG